CTLLTHDVSTTASLPPQDLSVFQIEHLSCPGHPCFHRPLQSRHPSCITYFATMTRYHTKAGTIDRHNQKRPKQRAGSQGDYQAKQDPEPHGWTRQGARLASWFRLTLNWLIEQLTQRLRFFETLNRVKPANDAAGFHAVTGQRHHLGQATISRRINRDQRAIRVDLGKESARFDQRAYIVAPVHHPAFGLSRNHRSISSILTPPHFRITA